MSQLVHAESTYMQNIDMLVVDSGTVTSSTPYVVYPSAILSLLRLTWDRQKKKSISPELHGSDRYYSRATTHESYGRVNWSWDY